MFRTLLLPDTCLYCEILRSCTFQGLCVMKSVQYSARVQADVCCAVLQPCFVFVGDGFDSNSELKMAKSLLLDFFRGRQIDAINLKVHTALLAS